jgi:hypothetical protein
LIYLVQGLRNQDDKTKILCAKILASISTPKRDILERISIDLFDEIFEVKVYLRLAFSIGLAKLSSEEN